VSLGTAAIAAVGGAVVGAAAVLLGLRMKAKAQGEPEKADPDEFTLLPPPNPDWTPGTKPTSPFGGEFETVHIADLRKNDVAPFEFFMTAMGPRMFHLCSTMHPDGTANLAPVCYLGPVSEDDPHIVMGVTRRKNDARPKDTEINVDATGEFVLNVVSSWCCEAAEHTAKRHAPDIDEFESSGFTKVASSSVKPFRCKETAIQLECKVVESVDLQDPDGAQASRVYIAKVVAIHFAKELMADGRSPTNPAIALSKGLKPVILIHPHQRSCVTSAFGDTKARSSYAAEFKACSMSLNDIAKNGDPQAVES